MQEGLCITCVDDPDDASVTTIGLGIRSRNEQQAGRTTTAA